MQRRNSIARDTPSLCPALLAGPCAASHRMAYPGGDDGYLQLVRRHCAVPATRSPSDAVWYAPCCRNTGMATMLAGYGQ